MAHIEHIPHGRVAAPMPCKTILHPCNGNGRCIPDPACAPARSR